LSAPSSYVLIYCTSVRLTKQANSATSPRLAARSSSRTRSTPGSRSVSVMNAEVSRRKGSAATDTRATSTSGRHQRKNRSTGARIGSHLRTSSGRRPGPEDTLEPDSCRQSPAGQSHAPELACPPRSLWNTSGGEPCEAKATALDPDPGRPGQDGRDSAQAVAEARQVINEAFDLADNAVEPQGG